MHIQHLHAFIATVVFVITMGALASYQGRKQQEWKNVLRVTIGVSLFVGFFCALFAHADKSNQWSTVGIFAIVCIAPIVFQWVTLCRQLRRDAAAREAAEKQRVLAREARADTEKQATAKRLENAKALEAETLAAAAQNPWFANFLMEQQRQKAAGLI